MIKLLSKAMLILSIIIMLGMLVMVSVAQDDTDDETPPQQLTIVEGEYVPPEEIATGLESFFNEHMNVPALAALVLVLTSFTKRYAPSQFETRQIQFFWVIVAYVGYALAVNWGYTVQLENSAELITKIGNLLLGATGTAVVSHHGYQLSKNAGVPILGTSRKQADG